MAEMFDFREFYMRVAQEMPMNCKVVEVGVADGASALFLAKCLDSLEKKYTLYMVDNLDYGGVNQLCTIYENIIASGLGKNIKVIPKGSLEAVDDFNNDSLDVVFIDSSHEYPETRESIAAWYEKCKDGAILSGHDVITAPGVTQAVNELLPTMITRPKINKPDQYQEFEPEQLLHIEDTQHGFGVFWLYKRFYWKPKL